MKYRKRKRKKKEKRKVKRGETKNVRQFKQKPDLL
jgi:hypothetical protein